MSAPAAAAPSFVCPLCRGALDCRPDAYACARCSRTYPILCGIPDFRVVPDRYISIEDDRQKGLRLFSETTFRTCAEMFDLYYSITPEIPAELARKFRTHQLAEVEIAGAYLAEFAGDGPLLDVGCSTGGLLIAAAGRFPRLVGVDVAFRWLVIGLVRLREAGVEATLACANAEHLPFASDAFGAVTAVDLVEHVEDPALVLGECRRVTAAGGVCYAATNNRYASAREPHVGVWGVGWLPRPLQARYVSMISGRAYRHITLRSAGELRRWARQADFAEWRLGPAPLAAPGRSPGLLAAYNRWRKPLSAALCRVAPRLQLICRK